MNIAYRLLSWFLALGATASSAQPYITQPNRGGWQFVAAPHTDVYFTAAQGEGLARRVAGYAELARYELAQLMDFSPAMRYSLYLAEDPLRLSFNHRSALPDAPANGVLQFPRLSAFVVYPGSQEALFREVKRQLALLILREFGANARYSGSLSANTPSSQVQWYAQGLVEYAGEGWNYEDEMRLYSVLTDPPPGRAPISPEAAAREWLLEQALDGNGYMGRIVRKSVWRYIASEYGEQKIAEILYISNLSRSVESGIISVLGITPQTLTDRWWTYLMGRASANAQGRQQAGQLPGASRITLPKGYELLSFAFHENSKRLALYLARNGEHSVWIHDPASGKTEFSGIRSVLPIHILDYPHSYPMAWSKDGAQLATVALQDNQYSLVYFKPTEGRAQYLPLSAPISRILSIDWSHDGQSLALSALRGGQTDIFVGEAGQGVFSPLTQDDFDDLEPVWSLDDQSIFFSSNRDTLIRRTNPGNRYNFRNTFDLYQLHFAEDLDSLTRITATPVTNERAPQAPNSYELLYLSDIGGNPNLQKINLFLRENLYLSELAHGVGQMQAGEHQMALSTMEGGAQQLYLAGLDNMRLKVNPSLSLLRLEKVAAIQLARARESRRQAPADTLRRSPAPPAPAGPAVTPADSAARSKPRFYIFDEDEAPAGEPKRNPPPRSNMPMITPAVKVTPRLEAVEVSAPALATTAWAADRVALSFGRRPDAGYFAGLQAAFSDRLDNQRLEVALIPYLDFGNFAGRNSDARIRYQNLRGRIDYMIAGESVIRHYRRQNAFPFALDSAILRFENLNLKAGLLYPLSRSSAIAAEGSLMRLARIDQKLLDELDQNERDFVVRAGLRYRFDRLSYREGAAYKGQQAELSVFSHYSAPKRAFLFHTLGLKAAAFTPLYRQMVMANHLQLAFSMGEAPQRFYMGGASNLLWDIYFDNEGVSGPGPFTAVNTDLTAMSFHDFAMPMRGFPLFARNGRNLILFNNEIRIPLSRLATQSLNTGKLYGFSLYPFLDIGSVWNEGNPFDRKNKNPTDIRVVGAEPVIVELRTLKSPFVFAFGMGLRTVFFGYTLRADFGWSVDDNTLRKPSLMLGVGQSF